MILIALFILGAACLVGMLVVGLDGHIEAMLIIGGIAFVIFTLAFWLDNRRFRR